MLSSSIPLSLYIHIPWCVKKCPYCDFNSYAVKEAIPENAYINKLLQDLDLDQALAQNRPIQTIFFGGGTPSLFSAQSIEKILTGVQNRLPFDPNIEITLEANPGTVEHGSFKDYKSAGINRISLGAQSFQNDKLLGLGRIHQAQQSQKALDKIHQAGFERFNIDIMYGLPNQSLEDALYDLKTALSFAPPHLSWYQLTIEPNTLFHTKKPILPTDENTWMMFQEGLSLLKNHGLAQYEVSAFSKPGFECQHNLNYWQFGDYIGIGAGAHGKITDMNSKMITRYWKTRYPKDYLDETGGKSIVNSKIIPNAEHPFEFMLNALRLTEGFPARLFEERLGIPLSNLQPILDQATSKELLIIENNWIKPTPLGKRFLNNLVELFLF